MNKTKEESCVFCDRIWGVFGVGLGMLITLIGIDLLSGGLISKMVGTPKAEIESDTEDEDENDNEDALEDE